jgi:hypothetical protein
MTENPCNAEPEVEETESVAEETPAEDEGEPGHSDGPED